MLFSDDQQFVRDDIPQAAAHEQRLLADEDRRRKATLVSEPAKKDIPAPPANIRPQPLWRDTMSPLADAAPCISLHLFSGATGSASVVWKLVGHSGRSLGRPIKTGPDQ